MADTLLRLCDACGQIDDHPRHVHGLSPDAPNPTSAEVAKKALQAAGEENFEAIYAQIEDQNTQVKHLDCCRADGCPDGSCDRIARIGVAVGEKKGDALRKELNSDEVSKVGEDLNEERNKEESK